MSARGSVLVIGSGIAGLTAAYRLSEAGFAVTVAEAAATPGGRMAELRQNDIVYNSGARLIYPFGRALHRLLADLGLRDALIPIRGLSAACRVDGAEYRLALMPNASQLSTPGLTLSDKMRLVAFAIRMVGMRVSVDPDDLASAAKFDDETLSDYCDRVIGPRARRRLIDPLFRGTRGWDAGEIAPTFLLTTLPHMIGRRSVCALRGGMGALTAALAARVNVRYRAEALRVEDTQAGCRTHFADGTRHDSDIAIVATEGVRALTLRPQAGVEERSFFAALRYNSLGIVHYRLRGEHKASMRFFDRDESGSLATFQCLPAAPAAGRPHAQLYCQLTPEATRHVRDSGRIGAIEPFIRDDVRRLFPSLDSDSDAHLEQWIAHKLPVPTPGAGRRIAAFRAWQADARRRIYYCGDYLAQALVTGACASGADAAALVARHWPARSAS